MIARLIEHLPSRQARYLRETPLRVLYWCCGTDEGLHRLAAELPQGQVVGLETQPAIVEEARRRFPGCDYVLSEDGSIPGEFDVIVAGGGLARVESPLDAVRAHLAACTRLYVALVPFDEFPLREGRRSQFRLESFPERVGDFVRLEATRVSGRSAGSDALLVIYASSAYLAEQLETAAATGGIPFEDPLSAGSRPGVLARQALSEEIADRVDELLPAGAGVLEVGGSGRHALALARRGRVNVALMHDSPEALDRARAAFSRDGLDAEFLLGDVFDPELKGDYDLVLAVGGIERHAADRQAEMLRGLGRMSARYVMVAWPNRECYWYWIWRIRVAGLHAWTRGTEIPMIDVARAIQAAGLSYLGARTLGERDTETLIMTLPGLSQEARADILRVHRSAIVPSNQKAYAVAALASVSHDAAVPPDGWSRLRAREDFDRAQLTAALADALAHATAIGNDLDRIERDARREIASLRRQIADRDRRIRDLQTTLGKATAGKPEDRRVALRDAASRVARALGAHPPQDD